MRWSGQAVSAEDGALPGMGRAGLVRAGLVRSVVTPEFAGITFHEVLCKSALNKVPQTSRLPFRYTVNAFRGCSHACRYCFARPTHSYLDLDVGNDFDTQVIVKINVVEVLRRELARSSWSGDPVALGTNTDPYQRAEGRYALMPGVIDALADAQTPLAILTKGTLLRRDLPLLAQASRRVPVTVAISLALLNPDLQRVVEPGTPTPAARLALVSAVRAAGLDCHVMVAPVLPYLSDGAEDLDRLLAAVAAAGATGATVLGLHLRGETRGWFMSWLASTHPDLVDSYRALFGRGAYLPAAYRAALAGRVAPLLRRHGLTADSPRTPRRPDPPGPHTPAAPSGPDAPAVQDVLF